MELRGLSFGCWGFSLQHERLDMDLRETLENWGSSSQKTLRQSSQNIRASGIRGGK